MTTNCTCDHEKTTKGTISILSLVFLVWLLFCPQKCCHCCTAPPPRPPVTVSSPVAPASPAPVVIVLPAPPAAPEPPAPAVAVVIPQVPEVTPTPAAAVPVPDPVVIRHPGIGKSVAVFGGTAFMSGALPAAEVDPASAFDRSSTTGVEDELADAPSGGGLAVSVGFTYRPGHSLPLLAYAITSTGHGPAELDPAAWRLFGVLPDGSERQLDRRSDEVFSGRTERRVFRVADVPACAAYRLEFTAASGGGRRIRLAQVEFINPR